MDSIVLMVMQIPTVAILFFAVYLFREVQKDRAALQAARETLENSSFEGSDSTSPEEIKSIRSEIESIRNEISNLAESTSGEAFSETDREQLANQKRALKEFGRVLSKTSEQTYNEMQDLDQRISALSRAMEANGFDIHRSVDAA